ncbi:MAG: Asp-tRNA(Asn)/Glu-tRNA(Gln) amidotransferase subunit GatC [Thermaerobacter sp.]|nr:Asp-tRNA(Asn)/Glu-tRNA(Gln) amidotransferase subunit GatC [Thermaerobacter sp.]
MAEEKIVPKLAALARLNLEDGEAERLERDLQSILHHVERLQALDLSSVEATYWPVGADGGMRPDEPGTSLPVEDGLGAAARLDGRYLIVPGLREDA